MVAAGLDRRRKSTIRPHRGLCETDQTDLRSISVPTLVLHGEDAQMVPMADAARKSIKLLRNGFTKIYPAICGMLTINADALNADLLAFIQV